MNYHIDVILVFINETIVDPKFSLVTLFLGFFMGNCLAMGRDRRKEVNATSDEFRKVLTQTLVDIHNENVPFDSCSIDRDSKKIQVAYLNYRPFLKRIYRNQYDEAWNQYDFYRKFQGIIDASAREIMAKDIEHLLEFTEYNLLKGISFTCCKTWERIRFWIFGPDKETKKKVKKFIEHRNSFNNEKL